MIIIGTDGGAKELLEIFCQLNYKYKIIFYNDTGKINDNFIKKEYDIITNINLVKKYLLKDNKFALGIGNPQNRYLLAKKFIKIGGELVNSISPYSIIGKNHIKISKGVTILTGSVLSSNIVVNEGVLINKLCSIGHDVIIGEYSVISPGVKILGNVEIGKYSFLGAGSIILPSIKIGRKSIVAAGAVVTKNVPINSIVAGIPAKVIKKL